MSPTELDRIANAAADLAGDVIRPYFRTRFDVATKEDRSFVTAADRGAEEAIRRHLTEVAPDHGIVGEEFGLSQTNADYCWFLDPIDGTHGFMAGMPTFGILIGLYDTEKPVLGILDQPVSGERWIAGAAGGVPTFNGTPMQTRACPALQDAILFTTDAKFFNTQQRAAYDALSKQVRIVRYGADCYAYGLLALGHVDVVAEANLSSYDIAALIPIIERAGGRVTDWRGNPLTIPRDLDTKLEALAVGDPRLLDAILPILTPSV